MPSSDLPPILAAWNTSLFAGRLRSSSAPSRSSSREWLQSGSRRDAGLLGVAFAHGLAIAIMVSAVGHISGAHFNPAITLGFLVTRRIDARLAVVYWIAQLAGAVVAALALRATFPDTVDLASGVPVLTGIGTGSGIVLEAILTFLLVWVVFATAVDPGGTFKSIAGLAIGLTITIDILAAGPLTGCGDEPGPVARARARLQRLGRLVGLHHRSQHRRDRRGSALRMALSAPRSRQYPSGRRSRACSSRDPATRPPTRQPRRRPLSLRSRRSSRRPGRDTCRHRGAGRGRTPARS